MKKIVLLLILPLSYSNCAEKNYSLGLSSTNYQLNNTFSILEPFIKFYNFFFKNKSFNLNLSTEARNQTTKNSLAQFLKINDKEIKESFSNYLSYSCSNTTIIKFDKKSKQYEVTDTQAGSKLTRKLSLYIHPDKFSHENKIEEQGSKEKAANLFQIIQDKQKLALIPPASKTFFIRCFFELLNKHSNIKEFEEDLNCIHNIAQENQFSLDEFSQFSIDEIIQKKNRLNELYKKSLKFKINQTVELTIQFGIVQLFFSRFGSKLAGNFIPYLKQAKKKQHYDEAYKHYKVDTIKNPNKKEYIIDQLKTEYNQYSHSDFLNKAIKTATPYLNSSQLKKVLRFF